jgi:pSer/pThr/pTyr-binding forkhead associated (FHA) protein
VSSAGDGILTTVADDITRTREVMALATGPRRAHLVIVSGDTPGRSVPIDRDVLVIGRSREADVQLDVVGVSRKHARITRGAGSTLNLIDLGAKNGTWLNGERVDVAALHHGDRIQIAEVVLQLVITQDEVLQPSPPLPSTPAEPQLGLSAREWEVAVEVARGLTNADIAKNLGISRRTVATHLERIYERLGIHSRAALAHRIARPPARGG